MNRFLSSQKKFHMHKMYVVQLNQGLVILRLLSVHPIFLLFQQETRTGKTRFLRNYAIEGCYFSPQDVITIRYMKKSFFYVRKIPPDICIGMLNTLHSTGSHVDEILRVLRSRGLSYLAIFYICIYIKYNHVENICKPEIIIILFNCITFFHNHF